jgi:hypothetical protein
VDVVEFDFAARAHFDRVVGLQGGSKVGALGRGQDVEAGLLDAFGAGLQKESSQKYDQLFQYRNLTARGNCAFSIRPHHKSTVIGQVFFEEKPRRQNLPNVTR